MKTLKALKITSILNGIFCFFCIIFVICLITNQYYHMDAIVAIGVIATFGWMLNPTPIISFIICFGFFLTERHSTEAKQIIEKNIFGYLSGRLLLQCFILLQWDSLLRLQAAYNLRLDSVVKPLQLHFSLYSCLN